MFWNKYKPKDKRKLKLFIGKTSRLLQNFRSAVHEFHFAYTRNVSRWLFALCGFLSIVTLTIEYGFYYNSDWASYIWLINSFQLLKILLATVFLRVEIHYFFHFLLDCGYPWVYARYLHLRR